MSDDDNVKKLPIRFKEPPSDSDPMLKIVNSIGQGCDHRLTWKGGRMISVAYNIREGETEVECGNCGTRLDPMFVLRRLATEETKFEQNRQRYQDEMRRLSERQRTTCDHCGKMTRISR